MQHAVGCATCSMRWATLNAACGGPRYMQHAVGCATCSMRWATLNAACGGLRYMQHAVGHAKCSMRWAALHAACGGLRYMQHAVVVYSSVWLAVLVWYARPPPPSPLVLFLHTGFMNWGVISKLAGHRQMTACQLQYCTFFIGR